jgi:hypothetical protein
MPPVAMTSPRTVSHRTPSDLISCCAIPAPTTIPAVIGRNATPAFSGP